MLVCAVAPIIPVHIAFHHSVYFTKENNSVGTANYQFDCSIGKLLIIYHKCSRNTGWEITPTPSGFIAVLSDTLSYSCLFYSAMSNSSSSCHTVHLHKPGELRCQTLCNIKVVSKFETPLHSGLTGSFASWFTTIVLIG